MHIGLIGGIGPAATEFYYRGLIDRHVRAGTALDLTIAHADVHEMARNLASGDARSTSSRPRAAGREPGPSAKIAYQYPIVLGPGYFASRNSGMTVTVADRKAR